MTHRPLYLLEYPTFSGGERSLLEIAKRTPDGLLLAPPGPAAQAYSKAGLEVVPFRIERGAEGSRKTVESLQTLASSHRSTLIHTNTLMTADIAAEFGQKTGLPTVAHIRDIMKISARRVEKISKVNRLVAVSQAVAEFLVRQGIPRSPIRQIYNGIDLETVHPEQIPSDSFEVPSLSSRESDFQTVSILGQISLRKGTDLFLDAAARCARKCPRTRFLIVGARFSVKQEARDLEQSIRSRAHQDPDLKGRVHFSGWIEDPLPVIAQSDIVVSCAREEPLSRVLLEATALARPIVATQVGGTPEIVNHGLNGLLVPPDDPEALARSLEDLLQNPSTRRSMGVASREIAKKQFDTRTTTPEVLKLHAELTGEDLSAQIGTP